MIVTIFRSRLREENQDDYGVWSREMGELAAQQPGFVSAKTFTAPDGERVTLAEFETEADVLAWRRHPRHQEAQERGYQDFYREYRIQVCRVDRHYGFVREGD